MSSGFVSGGTVEEPTERDDEWLKAQQELEAERRRKAEEGKQDGGKSLYEILQHNKAAKQEAFEESIKLKNQFRSLDEDEVEFLDSVLESTRAQEAALKRETREQLEIFHRQRQEADKVSVDTATTDPKSAGAASPPEEEQWTISGRKRRRAKDKDPFPGVKLRKGSSTDVKSSGASKSPPETTPQQARSTPNPKETSKGTNILENPEKPAKPAKPAKPVKLAKPEKAEEPEKLGEPETTKAKEDTKETKKTPAPVSSALGLGAYSSDDD
ncbi:hypothetical protein AJ79_02378 [Helicocarpus griseus UAMH5409]|uniref:FAM192A/Fyv6 N-terminal domain-containing protein n=1 Tax=Helicocarpus griseus UAMH5409 TaxID=1447875 RepID=A0A2B7Y291_9EURO|nr:hypothetical protein AJ79_02378 [Helicocarpus griseus UAMH5409]